MKAIAEVFISFVSQGKPFMVPVGSLGFGVVVYVIGATICIGFLLLRRFTPCMGRAELGGPPVPKYITSGLFLIIWVVYVLLSSLQAYDHISSDL